MKLSLLDLFGANEADDGATEDSITHIPSPIDLVGEIRRGWRLHPADANALFDAFSALGFLRGKQPADPAARDAGIIGAIERFQEANDIPPDGSMSRGGRTILHLDKALDPGRRARRSADIPTALGSPTGGLQRPSLLDSFLRARNVPLETLRTFDSPAPRPESSTIGPKPVPLAQLRACNHSASSSQCKGHPFRIL